MNVNFRQQGQYIRCSFQYNKQRVTMLVQNVSVTDINFSKAKSRFKSSATNSSEYNDVLLQLNKNVKPVGRRNRATDKALEEFDKEFYKQCPTDYNYEIEERHAV